MVPQVARAGVISGIQQDGGDKQRKGQLRLQRRLRHAGHEGERGAGQRQQRRPGNTQPRREQGKADAAEQQGQHEFEHSHARMCHGCRFPPRGNDHAGEAWSNGGPGQDRAFYRVTGSPRSSSSRSLLTPTVRISAGCIAQADSRSGRGTPWRKRSSSARAKPWSGKAAMASGAKL